jgi:hypothetical protein
LVWGRSFFVADQRPQNARRHVFQASDDVLASRRELAEQVCVALSAAGVPVHLVGRDAESSGAQVEVDNGDDDAGGVFVTWQPGANLVQAVVESMSQGQTDAPVIALRTSISGYMRDAIVNVLTVFGFRVVSCDDDMRPPAIKVLGGLR